MQARILIRILVVCLLALLGSGCATSPPSRANDICDIFDEKRGWYDDAMDAQEKWGVPVQISMAIIRQESGFRATARPPRRKLLWIIPWTRPSSAYGYAQALDSTWALYKRETNSWFADRDDFGDAVDFVGWYVDKTYKMTGASKWNAYEQYLAYHEGQTGFKRGTWKRKTWLQNVARKVDANAKLYGGQLARCRDRLDRSWF